MANLHANDGKLSSVLLFLVSYPFTEKINAVGISNLPAAFRAYRHATSKVLKHDAKRTARACLLCLFHSSTVFSAVFGRYPELIQAHAIVCIALSVRNSIDARNEEAEGRRLKQEPEAERGTGITGRLRTWMFGASIEGNGGDHDVVPVQNSHETERKSSKTVRAHKVVKKTKGILRGKRDSATDDVVWGAFQTSFVLLDQTVGNALAYAWLLFLLTVLEEALLNPKLSRKQRIKRFAVVAVTGFYCQNWVLSESGGFWLRLGRYAISLWPL